MVCQIDALQRLKPERGIIETALANLPRTLDETYERVFQRIPEESRSFVQHTLHWLSTHQSLHQAIPGAQRTLSCSFAPIDIPSGLDIPCEVLFQAIQESLADENSPDSMMLSGYVLDEGLLRELCGCLVTVTDYPVGPDSAIENMPVVSFAHYSVVEFLESARIRCGPAARFALDRERVMVEHAMVLLRGATASAERWGCELPQDPGSDFYSDFDRYCAHSSVLLLHWQAGILPASRRTTWMTPVVQLLEIRTTDIGSYFWYTLDALNFLENPITPSIHAFLQTHTLRFLKPPAESHLETLVRMLQMDERGYLAQNFLATLGRTSRDLAYQLDIEFQPGVFYKGLTCSMSLEEFNVLRSETLHFRGSILEFYAHFPPVTLVQPSQSLHKLLEFAQGHFDPSTLMLLCVPHHHHSYNNPRSQCGGCLVLTRLLRLGAQSTVPGFAVGSLQKAVALRDLETARLLLEAGVDANDIGDLRGNIGTPERGPMLQWFQHIRGRSPLNIAKGRYFADLRKTNMDLRGESSKTEADEQLEAILVQYGGRDFVISLDEDVSLATKMEEVKISETRREENSVTRYEEEKSACASAVEPETKACEAG